MISDLGPVPLLANVAGRYPPLKALGRWPYASAHNSPCPVALGSPICLRVRSLGGAKLYSPYLASASVFQCCTGLVLSSQPARSRRQGVCSGSFERVFYSWGCHSLSPTTRSDAQARLLV